jgi:carbon monoxide dehydrogenase subunit G
MDLNHTFTVPVPPIEAWKILTDLERIAPCMPGAQLTEVEGEEYRGQVKIKVGPITATYKGAARFVERDETGLRAVLRAEGRDARQGNANATITATLVPAGDGTQVTVDTDLMITGKVAQFGRGMLSEVSTKLIDQFVACLDADLLGGSGPTDVEPVAEPPVEEPPVEEAPTPTPEPEPAPVAAAPSAPRRIESAPAAPVDLVSTAGAPVAKRLVPALIGLALVIIAVRRLRKR